MIYYKHKPMKRLQCHRLGGVFIYDGIKAECNEGTGETAGR